MLKFVRLSSNSILQKTLTRMRSLQARRSERSVGFRRRGHSTQHRIQRPLAERPQITTWDREARRGRHQAEWVLEQGADRRGERGESESQRGRCLVSSSRSFALLDVDSHLLLTSISVFMYQHRGEDQRFDCVDLDPYGSAVPFLDAAMNTIADGGALSRSRSALSSTGADEVELLSQA